MNQQPIQRYALLRAQAQRFLASRQPIPGPLMAEMQQIEAQAKTVLSPQQMTAAMHFVEHETTRILKDEASKNEQAAAHEHRLTRAMEQQNRDTISRRMTKSLNITEDGLNEQEWDRAIKGLPVKRNVQDKTELDQKVVDQATRNATKHLDAKGQGWNEKQWRGKLESLSGFVNTNSWASRLRMAGIKDHPDLEKAVGRYESEWISGEMERRRPSAGETEVPTERSSRRAVIAKAFMDDRLEHGSRQDILDLTKDELTREAERISSDEYESKTMRGDIADAVLQHWDQDHADPEFEATYEEEEEHG